MDNLGQICILINILNRFISHRKLMPRRLTNGKELNEDIAKKGHRFDMEWHFSEVTFFIL